MKPFQLFTRALAALILATAFFTSGCLSTKSYLEPKYRTATKADIKAPAEPRPVTFTVIGQTNGKENKRVAKYWNDWMLATLTNSGYFRVAQANEPADTLTITINNFGDVGEAMKKGFTTGLTFGAAGNTVTDNYLMTVIYRPAGQTDVTRTYRHSLYTTIGNAEGPAGLSPIKMSEAGKFIAEDLILNFIKDLQAGLPPQVE